LSPIFLLMSSHFFCSCVSSILERGSYLVTLLDYPFFGIGCAHARPQTLFFTQSVSQPSTSVSPQRPGWRRVSAPPAFCCEDGTDLTSASPPYAVRPVFPPRTSFSRIFLSGLYSNSHRFRTFSLILPLQTVTAPTAFLTGMKSSSSFLAWCEVRELDFPSRVKYPLPDPRDIASPLPSSLGSPPSASAVSFPPGRLWLDSFFVIGADALFFLRNVCFLDIHKRTGIPPPPPF